MSTLTSHQEKALNRKSHLSLTANAGSGKTYVLIKRYLEIALNEDVSLNEILAITFTEKAASELYRKIADEINNQLQNADETVRKKLESLRRQLVSANISTIHSFCINVLREFPVEAGIDANFNTIEQNLSEELIELSVEEVIKKNLLQDETSSKLKTLVRLLGSIFILSSELKELITKRKNVLEVIEKIYSKPEEDICKFFRDKFTTYIAKIITHGKNEFILNIKKINNTALSSNSEFGLTAKPLIEELNGNLSVVNFLSMANKIGNIILTNKGDIREKQYLGKKQREGLSNEIEQVENYFQLISRFAIPENADTLEKNLVQFGFDIITIFNETLALYNQKKKENGYLDFEDILLLTKKIFEAKDVQEIIKDKYKFVMVDEYQDTNELQYKIFLPILNYLKSGNLFVVGDEKQSIYMFRDAELEVFNQTKQDIAEESGKENLLTLPESFRMSPPICAFTNYLFANLFSNPEPMFNEVEHSEIICAKSEELEGKVEIILADPTDNSEVNAEESLLSKRIIKLITKDNLEVKPEWKDVAVLCRKRKSFIDIEKEFIKRNIPFSIIGGKGFYQRQLVYDILNYFSFLLNKEDDAALVGLLRSPFFLIPDSQIFEIAAKDEKTFWEKLISNSNNDLKINDAINILKENLILVNTSDIISLLRKITSETNYLSVLASRTNGEQEIANFEKLIQLTRNFLSQGFRSLYDYVSFLNDSIDNTDDEGQAAPIEDTNTVKIMTIHQAKGLEFKAVFLFGCHEKAQSGRLRARTIRINKDFGLLTKLPPNQDYFEDYQSAPIILLDDYIQQRKNFAEIKRLFYVAVTRAKNYLFISGMLSKNNIYNEESFLGLLKKGLNINFENDNNAYEFNTEIKYLRISGNSFKNETGNIQVSIPILKNIDEITLTNTKVQSIIEQKDINVKKIDDLPAEEIISATKMAIFKQCPIKYMLTYDFGFLPIHKNFKEWLSIQNKSNRFEFNEKEDNRSDKIIDEFDFLPLKQFADIKGRISHSVLEYEIPTENLVDFIEQQLNKEFTKNKTNEKTLEALKTDIFIDISKFYQSSAFNTLIQSKNYKNEFEIYLKEKDYFLYGIIDKIIFNDKCLQIIDYKTDDITKTGINEKADHYLNQLKFYAYILSKVYNNVETFILQLIFIKAPDETFSKSFTKSEIESFGKEIDEMVLKIRNKDYIKNLSHCKSCVYAVNYSNCILE